jgi:hypothetical protein
MPPTWIRLQKPNVHIVNYLPLNLPFQVSTQNRHLEASRRGHLPFSALCGLFFRALVSRCKKCRPPGYGSESLMYTLSTVYPQTCLPKCRPKIDTWKRTDEVTGLAAHSVASSSRRLFPGVRNAAHLDTAPKA